MKIQVYTVNGRLVEMVLIPLVQPGSTVTLALIDKAGITLSNGLYYIALTASNGQRVIVKLLVLR